MEALWSGGRVSAWLRAGGLDRSGVAAECLVARGEEGRERLWFWSQGVEVASADEAGGYLSCYSRVVELLLDEC